MYIIAKFEMEYVASSAYADKSELNTFNKEHSYI